MSVVQSFLRIFSSWYCHQPGIGFLHVCESLRQRFENADDAGKIFEIFLDIIRLDDSIQLAGEDALIKLIESNRAKISLVNLAVSEFPKRRIDWPKTKTEHYCGNVANYYNRVNIKVPDKALLGAFKFLANQWRNELSYFLDQPMGWRCDEIKRKQYESRRMRLETVIEQLSTQQEHPWLPAMSVRLRQLDKVLATAIERARSPFNPSPEGLQDRISHYLQGLETVELKARNENSLFEWYVALKIAKSATEAGWVMGLQSRNAALRYSDIYLKKGSIQLRISKGHPTNGDGKRILTEDPREKILIAHQKDPTGLQPDIVLTFWRESDPENVVTYLADAKNGGDQYFDQSVSRGFMYLFAFQPILKNQQNPQITLFFSELGETHRYHWPAGDGANNNAPHQLICINPEEADCTPWFNYVSTQSTRTLQVPAGLQRML